MPTAIRLTVRATGALAAALAALALALAPCPAAAAAPAWTTYDHDAARTATDPDSTSPLAPSVAWGPTPVDGKVYAQPLVYGSLVYVATENDTVYALDAASGAVVWQHSLGTPVPSGELPCGDIGPTVGITSTPVIDASAGRLYAVADVLSGGAVQHRLTALSLGTGAPVAGFPIAVDPPGQDPTAILQRGALALDAGRVIIPYGGNYGDCFSYHGWLVSVAESGAGAQATFEVDAGPHESQGSIWGAGDGPAQDAAGHLFVETGNGNSSSPDLQESVLELDPNMPLLAHWTAPNWKQLDQSDTDLGSAEPLPLPGGLLFVAGKDGVGRLLSATSLSSAGQLYSASICSGQVYGASLYRAGIIYVPCTSGLLALSLSASGSPRFSKLASFSTASGAVGPPIFAGGLVWSTGWSHGGTLYGLDPASGAVSYQTSLGSLEHFATPSAAGGRLFVGAGARVAALRIAAYSPPPVTVSPGPPSLSHASLKPGRTTARHGTTLRFRLSRASAVRVQLSRRGARRVRTLELRGRAGADRFRLNLRRLPAGRYLVTVLARGNGGRRSRTITLRLVIVPARRR